MTNHHTLSPTYIKTLSKGSILFLAKDEFNTYNQKSHDRDELNSILSFTSSSSTTLFTGGSASLPNTKSHPTSREKLERKLHILANRLLEKFNRIWQDEPDPGFDPFEHPDCFLNESNTAMFKSIQKTLQTPNRKKISKNKSKKRQTSIKTFMSLREKCIFYDVIFIYTEYYK